MLSKDKSFYKSFFTLMGTLVLQNVIVLSVNLADNIMIGGYSEAALAGVAAVNQLQFIFSQLILGTGDALVAVGSQYWGQKKTEPIKHLTKAALLLGVGVALFFFVLMSVIPDKVLGLFTDSDAIVAAGCEYVKTIRFTYVVFALTQILVASLRSVESVKIAFWTAVESLILNVALNWVMIGGNLGCPAMGATGAAIATLIARLCECITVLLYLICKDKKLCWRATDLRTMDKSLLHDYYRACVFIVVVAGMFGVSTALQTVILGHMNDNAIAANSVAQTLFQILKVASIGAASASAVQIGKAIGRGDRALIKEYTYTMQCIYLCVGLLTGTILFLLRGPILACYTLSDETEVLAKQFLTVLSVTIVGTAYEMPVFSGIIKGGGSARFVFVNDLISIWGIVLPVSFLAAFVWHFPPAWVLFCLNADQLFKCATAAIKVNRFHWMKKLTR